MSGVIVQDKGENYLKVNSDGSLNVSTTFMLPNEIQSSYRKQEFVSVANVTNGTAAGQGYVSPKIDTISTNGSYKRVSGYVMSDQTGNLYILGSDDDVNYRVLKTIAVTATTTSTIQGTTYQSAQPYDEVVQARFGKVAFVNTGAAATTKFDICGYSAVQ